jgi:hypothetical protein
MAAMSNATQRAAAAWAIAASAAAETRPSPSAVFSLIDQTRCVDAMSVVRSSVTRPRWTARAAPSARRRGRCRRHRHRHQRQHRLGAGGTGRGGREQLDVVDGRAGALGDASTEVACASQPLCSARSTIQSARTPPPRRRWRGSRS